MCSIKCDQSTCSIGDSSIDQLISFPFKKGNSNISWLPFLASSSEYHLHPNLLAHRYQHFAANLLGLANLMRMIFSRIIHDVNIDNSI